MMIRSLDSIERHREPGVVGDGERCLFRRWHYRRRAQRARASRDVAANGLVLGGVGARHRLGG